MDSEVHPVYQSVPKISEKNISHTGIGPSCWESYLLFTVSQLIHGSVCADWARYTQTVAWLDIRRLGSVYADWARYTQTVPWLDIRRLGSVYADWARYTQTVAYSSLISPTVSDACCCCWCVVDTNLVYSDVFFKDASMLTLFCLPFSFAASLCRSLL